MGHLDRPSDRERVVTALRELIEALDRRVPHVERLGEVGIARDARLRTRAHASAAGASGGRRRRGRVLRREPAGHRLTPRGRGPTPCGC